MNILELLLIAVGLSMDAFAVSVCKGLGTEKVAPKNMFGVGLWFGSFQALMPFIGYCLGSAFERFIVSFDHWTAFILLFFIGGNMIKESFSGNTDAADGSLKIKIMLPMSIATSIDALAAGVTFGLLPDINIIFAITVIGITTFVFSASGVKFGNVFGAKYKSKAEFAGGTILILIGTKILLEHLGIIM